jgi:hypothetical protein
LGSAAAAAVVSGADATATQLHGASMNGVMSRSCPGVKPSSTSSAISIGEPAQSQLFVVPPSSLADPSVVSAVADGSDVELVAY